MRQLTFTNAREESITLAYGPFLIESLSGIGEVDAETQTQNAPYQDGSTYIDTLLQPRFPSVEGAITKTDLTDIRRLRGHMSRVLNPKLGMGELRLDMDGVTRIIDAAPDGTPVFPDKGQNPFQKFQINFICPNPYWKSLNETSHPLQSYVGNFTLPTTFPIQFGVSGSSVTLYNEGDIPAPVRIDIQGPVTRPQIINNTTGEWIRVNRAIAADEILHINTEQGSKRVEIYRGNEVYPAFGYLDHDSQWITLEIGENEISHIADAGDRNSLVAVTWNDMFTGI